MKNKKSVLIIWTFFTSLLLTFSSYAWFSSNKVLGFQTFNIHIASKGGIEISSDAINWKGVLALSDIIDARRNYPTSTNQVPYSLEPVSSGGVVDSGYLRIFSGEVTQDNFMNYILKAERSVEEEGFGTDSTGKFVAFDVFFKNISSKTLYVTPESSVLQDSNNFGIENAFRIAFLNQGTISIDSTAVRAQSLHSAVRTYIWEPNYDVHTDYGVSHAKNTYGIDVPTSNAPLLNYDGIISSIEISDNVRVEDANSILNPTLFKKVNVDIATKSNFSSNVEIFSIEPGITKVRIYIWIEGQDVDCEDNASVGDVSINLQLSTEPY